jgi:hypothetical protein
MRVKRPKQKHLGRRQQLRTQLTPHSSSNLLLSQLGKSAAANGEVRPAATGARRNRRPTSASRAWPRNSGKPPPTYPARPEPSDRFCRRRIDKASAGPRAEEPHIPQLFLQFPVAFFSVSPLSAAYRWCVLVYPRGGERGESSAMRRRRRG